MPSTEKRSGFDYSPINNDNELTGLKAAFGKTVRPHYSLAEAQVVLCLDADPLANHPDALNNVKGWSSSRVPEDAVMKHRH